MIMAFFKCIPGLCVYLNPNENYIPEQPVEIITTKDFDLGEALLSKYDIVDIILNYLTYSDLKNLSQLSVSWKDRVSEVIEKRISPNVFCFSETPALWKYGGECHFSKPLMSIIFINDATLKLHNRVCIHRGTNARVSDYTKASIEFIEEDVIASKNCPLVTLSCKQTDICVPYGMFFNGLVLPCIPNIKVSVFRIPSSKKEAISRTLSEQIGEDNYVSCLMVFCLSIKRQSILKTLRPVITEIRKRQPSQYFSFGGGLVTGMKTFNIEENKKTKKSDDLLCITFSKSKNYDVQFDSYSIKLTTETNQCYDEVETNILELKNIYKPRQYSVVFRFSCQSVDENIQEVIEIFTKHFPNTKMIGFGCNGEIGWNNFMPESDETEPKKKKPSAEKLLDYFTVVFVMLSWGKEI